MLKKLLWLLPFAALGLFAACPTPAEGEGEGEEIGRASCRERVSSTV